MIPRQHSPNRPHQFKRVEVLLARLPAIYGGRANEIPPHRTSVLVPSTVWRALALLLAVFFCLSPIGSIQAQGRFDIRIDDIRADGFRVTALNVPSGTTDVSFIVYGGNKSHYKKLRYASTGNASWRLTDLPPRTGYVVNALWQRCPRHYCSHNAVTYNPTSRQTHWSRGNYGYARTTASTLAPAPLRLDASASDAGVNLNFGNVPKLTRANIYYDIQFDPAPRRGLRRIYIPAVGSEWIPADRFAPGQTYTVTFKVYRGDRPEQIVAEPAGYRVHGPATATFTMPGAFVPGDGKPTVPYTVVHHDHNSILLSFSAVAGTEHYRISRPSVSSSSFPCSELRPLAAPHEHDTSAPAAPGTVYKYCFLSPNTEYRFIIKALRRQPAGSADGMDTLAISDFKLRTHTQPSSRQQQQDPPTPVVVQEPVQALPSLSLNFSDLASTSVTVSWNDVSADEYALVYSDDGGSEGGSFSLSAETTSRALSGLTAGRAYEVVVFAYFPDGRFVETARSLRTLDPPPQQQSAEQAAADQQATQVAQQAAADQRATQAAIERAAREAAEREAREAAERAARAAAEAGGELKISFSGISQDSLTVNWNKMGGSDVAYYLSLSGAGASQAHTAPSHERSHTFRGLSADTVYDIYVEAYVPSTGEGLGDVSLQARTAAARQTDQQVAEQQAAEQAARDAAEQAAQQAADAQATQAAIQQAEADQRAADARATQAAIEQAEADQRAADARATQAAIEQAAREAAEQAAQQAAAEQAAREAAERAAAEQAAREAAEQAAREAAEQAARDAAEQAAQQAADAQATQAAIQQAEADQRAADARATQAAIEQAEADQRAADARATQAAIEQAAREAAEQAAQQAAAEQAAREAAERAAAEQAAREAAEQAAREAAEQAAQQAAAEQAAREAAERAAAEQAAREAAEQAAREAAEQAAREAAEQAAQQAAAEQAAREAAEREAREAAERAERAEREANADRDLKISFSGISQNSLTVNWNKMGGGDVAYYVQLTGDGARQAETAQSHERSFTFRGLDADTDYEVYVEAYNTATGEPLGDKSSRARTSS